MNKHHIKPNHDSKMIIDVTPESAEWDYLSFAVVKIGAGETHSVSTPGIEMAIVPLVGSGTMAVAGGETYAVSRKNPFDEMPHILYLPPGHEVEITGTNDGFEFAYGSAPAEGKYPLRLFKPEDMKSEVRGGGVALRQVNHVLAHPLPAERLILFEVYVPGGAYSGWPPHCHDGYEGSAYLEETYYYRMQPEHGFAMHRNYRKDNDFDETFSVKNGELVLVTEGFHPVAVPPGSNVYFLNYLAGELIGDDRKTPPFDDPDWGWMKTDYEGGRMSLPVGASNSGAMTTGT
ncbi:MAG: 5-deoxy-glucuronate isomerase [Anaerolineae bacterium]